MLSQSDLEGLIAPIILKEFAGRTLTNMSFMGLKEQFPELTGLTYHNGNQVLHVGDRQIEISPMASNEEIRAALQNPWIPTRNTKVSMSITGLQQGAFAAKLADLKKKMSDKQNAGIAQIDSAITAAAQKVDDAVAGVNAKIDAEVSNSLQEFAQFTNGGPS